MARDWATDKLQPEDWMPDQSPSLPKPKKGYHLMQAEKEYRERNRLCAYCGRSGHAVEECRKKAERDLRAVNELCVYCGKGGHKLEGCPKRRRRGGTKNLSPRPGAPAPSNVPNPYRLTPPKIASLSLPEVVQAIEAQSQPYRYQSIEEWSSEFAPELELAYLPCQPTPRAYHSTTSADPGAGVQTASSIAASNNTATQSTDNTTQTTVAVLVPVRRPTGFFDLPRELRTRIYLVTLRPDCKLQFPGFCKLRHDCVEDPHGCMKLLTLSPRIYFEAIELLHGHENVITINCTSKVPLFRKARDFGKPGMFSCSKPGNSVFIGPRYSELQFLRFRKVALRLQLPGVNTGIEAALEYLARFEEKLLVMLDTLQKSPNLRQVRLLIDQSQDLDYHAFFFLGRTRNVFWEGHSLHHRVDNRIKKVLRHFISIIHSKGIKTSAEEHRIYHGRADEGQKKIGFRPEVHDPLVAWVNAVTPLELRSKPAFSYHMDLSFTMTDARGDTLLMQHVYYDAEDKYPDSFVKEEEQRFIDSFGKAGNAVYELIPECRACYRLFGSWEDLKAHLDEVASHKQSFRAKESNKIVPSAGRGGWIKCPTCADVFDCKRLDQHLNRTGHRRWGRIPRYKEDNWMYNRKNQERQQVRYMWDLPGYYRPDYGG